MGSVSSLAGSVPHCGDGFASLPADDDRVESRRLLRSVFWSGYRHLGFDRLHRGDHEPGLSEGLQYCDPTLDLGLMERERQQARGLQDPRAFKPHRSDTLAETSSSRVLNLPRTPRRHARRIGGERADAAQPRMEEVGEFAVVNVVHVRRVGDDEVNRLASQPSISRVARDDERARSLIEFIRDRDRQPGHAGRTVRSTRDEINRSLLVLMRPEEAAAKWDNSSKRPQDIGSLTLP